MTPRVAHTDLRISEIFFSLQGEARFAGIPTVFIRLTGCPLRCQYCDTTYAFTGGETMPLADILARVAQYECRYVTVTGGEPLAQKGCIPLLAQLCDQGYTVALETSGALDISEVDSRVCRVMDIKTPQSGEAGKNIFSNIEHLTDHDQVKFVICDRADYDWMKGIIQQYALPARCEILVQAAYRQFEPSLLGDWILRDNLPVRLQIQLHKQLWGDVPGK